MDPKQLLDDARRKRADEVFENYDFDKVGLRIEARNGWENDLVYRDRHRRLECTFFAYIVSFDSAGEREHATKKCRFFVVFQSGTDVVERMGWD